MAGKHREMTQERIDTLQKRASMFGCALYLVAFVVLAGVFIHHLVRD